VAARLVILGALPGYNESIAAAKSGRGKSNAYARVKKAETERVAWAAKAQRVPKFERIFLRFVWVETDRARNPDNIASAKKYLIDGLVLAGVIRNDGWKEVAGWSDTFEVGPRAGVEVTIEAA
jgi:hypothetical protein